MSEKLLLESSGHHLDGQYEPTDSEDDYSEGEKELLEEVRQSRRRGKERVKELLPFADSSDEDAAEDADVGELMGDSDIEGAEDDDADMPDSKDWGSKSRYYYNTDFVDPDYSAYNEQEEELAKLEEEEAKVIQRRLADQMKEEDFQLDELFAPATTETVDMDTEDAVTARTKVKADLAGLSKRERQQLFQKDSPEFVGLMVDYKEYLAQVETLLTPVLKYAKEHEVPLIPALEFAQLYRNMLLTYCSNVAFYLLLKAKRVPVKHHPVTKRLLQLKKLLGQLKDKHENIIQPQLEALLERIVDGDQFEVLPIQTATAGAEAKPKRTIKTKLSVLDDYDIEEEKPVIAHAEYDHDNSTDENELAKSIDANDGEADEDIDEDTRRGITYQIAKNKGLMPHRKKEMRNPRVKHRNKFRKALIRRKGAVRTVRTETKRYGGEISGIKAGVSKSIKFKS